MKNKLLTLGALALLLFYTANTFSLSSPKSLSDVGLGAVSPQTYFVSSQGDDKNSGSINSPFKTIHHALQMAKNGGTIKAIGHFDEDVIVNNSKGVQLLSQGASVKSIHVKNSQDIQIIGFTIVGPKILPLDYHDMPGKNMAAYRKAYQTFEGPNYSLFTSGIRVDRSSNVSVAHNHISLHTIGIHVDGGTNITVEHNVCHHCRDGIWSTGSGFNNSIIRNNHCYQNLNAGITAGSSRHTNVQNNLCELNGIHNFVVLNGSSDCLVQYNTGKNGGTYTENMSWPGSSCFNFFNIGARNVADGNVAIGQIDPTGNDGNGFINDRSSNGMTFTNNIATGNAGTGISLTKSSNNKVINNTCTENGKNLSNKTNGAGVRWVGCTGNVIHNNILIGNRLCGIHGDGTMSRQDIDYNLYGTSAPAIWDSFNKGDRVFIISPEKHGIKGDDLTSAKGRGDKDVMPEKDHQGNKRITVDIGAAAL